MLSFARAGAVLTGAAATLMVAAAPAGADAASGLVDRGADLAGFTVDVGDGVFDAIGTSLIGLRLSDGTVLGTYCVQIDTEIDEEQELVERPWEEFPEAGSLFNQNQDKINWVLHNGFPVGEVGALTEALTEAGAELSGGIDDREAITATQAAVWHFSDGTDLDREDPLPGDESGDAAAADVLALYDFLTGRANVGMAEQPTAALAIEPESLAGGAGELIGPFTVSTTAEAAELTADLPEGVRLTDGDGNDLDASRLADGTEVFVSVPQDAPAGEAIVEVTATAVVDTGRLFVAENHDETPSQPLIVAKAVETEVSVSAQASWNEGGEAAAPADDQENGGNGNAGGEDNDGLGNGGAIGDENDGGNGNAGNDQDVANAANEDEDDSVLSDLAETGASIMAPVLLGLVLIGAGIVSVLVVRNRRRV